MKKYLLLLIALLALSACGHQTPAQRQLTKSGTANLWIMTDNHLIADALHDDGPEFTYIKGTAAGKDLDYQEESLAAFRDKALKEKPTAVIFTGDLTLNGEKISGEKLAELFEPLQKAGIPVLAIPGNHDIHDGWARSYQGETKARTRQISPADFRNLFPDGFTWAADQDDSSLSYSLPLNNQYQLIFLDTNHYPQDTGTGQPATGGSVREKTFQWLQETLTATEKAKKTPLIFMHHNLFVHNALVNKGYVLDNAAEVTKLLADHQVPVVFSGHIHAQDIMKDPTGNSQIIEVVTSSYAIADHGYGQLTLTKDQLTYQRETVDVNTWAKNNGKTDPNLLQHDHYLKELFLKDGARMAYQQLIEKKIYEDAILDPAAELVAQSNYDYFTGNDQPTDEELAALKNSPGYQTITEHAPFLKEYLATILQDHNLNDQHLVVDLK